MNPSFVLIVHIHTQVHGKIKRTNLQMNWNISTLLKQWDVKGSLHMSLIFIDVDWEDFFVIHLEKKFPYHTAINIDKAYYWTLLRCLKFYIILSHAMTVR